jgi:hypothetical protein
MCNVSFSTFTVQGGPWDLKCSIIEEFNLIVATKMPVRERRNS